MTMTISLAAAGCGGGDDDAETAATIASAKGTTAGSEGTSTTATPTTVGSTTTTAPAEIKLSLDKAFWFKGFAVTLTDAVFTPDPQSKPPVRAGELVINGTATNLTDGGLDWGFIGQQSDLSIETAGDTFPLAAERKDVPEGGKAKIQLTADLEAFDQTDAVLVFGGPKVNGSRVPLGTGPVVTVEPKKVTLSAVGATPSGLSLTLLSAEITSFALHPSGGTATQANAGELFVKLSGKEAYSGTVNNGMFSPALVRPDGLTSAADSTVGYKVIDPGQESLGYHVFAIPAKAAGAYTLRFSGSSSQDKAEVAFTLP